MKPVGSSARALPLLAEPTKAYSTTGVGSGMAKTAPEIRVKAKQTVKVGALEVTNRTTNSITVRKTTRGLIVTNCCLEEQGL
jgi:hypothetical protein